MSDDREYFEALYRAHYLEILRFAVRRVDLQSACDVAAETFLTAWRRLETVRASDVRAWLFVTARNLVGNEQRGQARRARLTQRLEFEQVDLALDPADVAIDHISARTLLESLTAKEREALQLTEWERLDVGTAAHVAGCSLATFRVRLHRARRRLAAVHASQTTPAPAVASCTSTPSKKVPS